MSLERDKIGEIMSIFQIVSEFQPTGDQPQAIEALTTGFKNGEKFKLY